MQRLLFPHFIFQANIFYALVFLFSLIGCAKYSEQVQANLTKLKNTKSCPGCDLSGIELISFDLKNADLSGANLTGANLRRSDLRGANLTGANLTDADLMGADLTGAKLIQANLSGVRFNTKIKFSVFYYILNRYRYN